MVGLARAVLYRRERLLMLQPRGKGLVAYGLHYANEVRSADTYFDDVPDMKLAPEMLALANHILESKRAHFDPKQFKDRYEAALTALIDAKRAGKEAPALPEPATTNVVNLMDALRRSLQAERSAPPASTPAPASRRAPASRSTAARRGNTRGRMKKAG